MYTFRRISRYAFAAAGLLVLAVSVIVPSIRVKGSTVSLEGDGVAHADVPSCDSCSTCSSCVGSCGDDSCSDSGSDAGCAGSPGE
ncbi:MAG: hypothetical protein KBE09_00220 [Candidatus Pacebacteria bacterium]|nr:hypothetical protein [Candidatus Paceibacterota bacterium]